MKEKLERDSSGHDWWHIYRVVQTTKRIAAQEGADGFVCELAALLHDVVDEKLNADPAAAQRELEAWLAASGTPAAQVRARAGDHQHDVVQGRRAAADAHAGRPGRAGCRPVGCDWRGRHLARICLFGLERPPDSRSFRHGARADDGGGVSRGAMIPRLITSTRSS